MATTTLTTATSGGDAEHVSLNHRLASPYQGVKVVPAMHRGRTAVSTSTELYVGC